jgi:hypothetical protein
MLQVTQSPGIHSDKFLDINKLEHSFPEELKSVGFAVTLLHNHSHAGSGFLVYAKDYKTARYLDKSSCKFYKPCSWYL